MKVVLATSAGFCWGVKRAIDRARAVARERGAPVYTDGPLIHNQQMMEQLRREGIEETQDPASVGRQPLLIRAHGVPPDRRRALGELEAELHDATCPDVARIQGLIRRHAHRGFHTIIYGDTGHAEVVGLLGYAEGRGHVVGSECDVDALPNDLEPVCLVSQSTQFPAAYARIAAAVQRRFPGALVLDTICEATKSRQRELLDICEQVDAVVVVGGAHSANTVRLVELASEKRPTFHIQTGADIVAEAFHGYRSVGLTAGASTPGFIIEDVRRRLEAL